MQPAITGSCHCGALQFQFNDTVKSATECNCSICRRLGALWIYTATKNIKLTIESGADIHYSHGQKSLSFTSCKNCGCTLCWSPVDGAESDTMAVNLRLAPLEVIDTIPVKRFDGADTWTFVD